MPRVVRLHIPSHQRSSVKLHRAWRSYTTRQFTQDYKRRSSFRYKQNRANVPWTTSSVMRRGRHADSVYSLASPAAAMTKVVSLSTAARSTATQRIDHIASKPRPTRWQNPRLLHRHSQHWMQHRLMFRGIISFPHPSWKGH